MSRYQVDKALRQIAKDPAAREAFLRDRASFLDGRDLTLEERKAIIEVDYPRLYALGAHPFLVHAFVNGLGVLPKDRRAARTEYCNKIAPFGRPDYAT
jgi:hypothetical protein